MCSPPVPARPAPGRPEPTVFGVDGVRFGLAICIEATYPALFAEYQLLDVHCVLASVMVDDPARAAVAQAYGTLCHYWRGYAVPAADQLHPAAVAPHPGEDATGTPECRVRAHKIEEPGGRGTEAATA